MELNRNPIVFISYSWDDESHKEWVLQLSTDLRTRYGVDILLDRFELSVGKNMTAFMEKSLENADKVLIILTPEYKHKAENRKGGAGFEHSIISQDLYSLQDSNAKFLPVLRKGELQMSAPGFIKTLIYHSMKDDNQYESDLQELVRIIYNKPKIEKPILGQIPNFNEIQILDPIVERANRIKSEERAEVERLNFLNTQEARYKADEEVRILFEEISKKAEKYRNDTPFWFNVQHDNCNKLNLYAEKFAIRLNWSGLYYNSLIECKLKLYYFNKTAPPLDGRGFFLSGDEPEIIKSEEYFFDVDTSLNAFWRTNNVSKKGREDMIKNCFVWLMDMMEQTIRSRINDSKKKGW